MFWKVQVEERRGEPPTGVEHGGARFVLHRHEDAGGTHLDLRLEQPGGYLMGWRIDGDSLNGEPWATEKLPHPVEWLDRNGPATREDAGTFEWLEGEEGMRRLVLRGMQGERVVSFTKEWSVGPAAVRAVAEALKLGGASDDQAAQLVSDGIRARERAVERLCGLGRELDEAAFDEGLWRRTLEGLALDEIQAYLRAYEVRFDQKYPPQRVSEPEPLEEGDVARRSEEALAIVRGDR